MSVQRPVIASELAEEIDRRRGDVPFQRYVNGLLRVALDQVKAHEHDTPPPSVVPKKPSPPAATPRLPDLPKIAPRRT